VIIGQDGEVLSRARNRRYERGNFPLDAKNQEIMHAEIQCILALDDTNLPRASAELYTTMEPCPMCLGTWFMSSMAVLHYAARDPYAGSADLLQTTWYMQLKGKKAFGPEAPWLENLLIGLLVETEIRIRGNFHENVKQRWEPILPEGVGIGYQMASDNQLQKFREASAQVEEAFKYLIANYD
jgi:tRNA(Arg) A34 adenosine deaminase TadA